MSNRRRKKVLIEVGDSVKFIGEVDCTTTTILPILEEMKRIGLEFEVERKGLSLFATTLCG